MFKNIFKYKNQALLIIILILITMRAKANTNKKHSINMQPTLYNFKKSKRNIKYIVVHTTGTPVGKDFNAADIDRMHKQNGWSGIGYNYLIKLDGTLEIGRDVDQVPAHVQGYNTNSIGISYVGGEAAKNKYVDSRTPAQKNTLLNALIQLRKLYPNAIIQGHRDFPNVAKACPCFDAKKEFSNI